MELRDIGVVGMAVMGSNLALNMADHGFAVSVYNYTPDLTEKFVTERPHDNIKGYYDLKEFIGSLKKPRKIMLMIMAGAPVDSMIEQLIPILDGGDIIIESVENGVVTCTLIGQCSGCPSRHQTLRYGILQALQEEIPEILDVKEKQ